MSKSQEPNAEPSRPVNTELATVSSGAASANVSNRAEFALATSTPYQDPDDAPRAGPGGMSLYLHAFRRCWPLAITLGLACAAALMVPAWFLAKDHYTAVALLQISANEQQLVPQNDRGAAAGTFEIYKGTQQQFITSDNVLIAALRPPEIANLDIVQQQDDPVRWLAKNLKVDLPLNTEIMKVSLTGTQPEQVKSVVQAVVDAYMKVAVGDERDRQRARLSELDKLYKEKEEESRSKRTELKTLADQLGTGDSGALALKQQIALQQYGESRNELSRLRTELQKAKADLQVLKIVSAASRGKPAVKPEPSDNKPADAGKQPTAPVNGDTKEKGLQVESKTKKDGKEPQTPPEPTSQEAADLDLIFTTDPVLAKLTEQIGEIKTHLATMKEKVGDSLYSHLTAEEQAAVKSLQDRADTRKKELTAKFENTNRAKLGPQMAELQERVHILTDQEIAAAKDLDEQRVNAEKFGHSSIDVEMMRSELQFLDKVLGPIADERERIKGELRSKPRITEFQKAAVPPIPDSKARLQAVAVAGLGGFCLAIFLILRWDLRKQRINSMAELSRGLGLTVVGSVPLLPQKAIGGKRSNKRHKWQTSMDHAVDSIAARLFLRKDSGGVRVVMVSSATQGEGKTTLAVQLATRLARTGGRTLLVDYDLRRPSIHRIFEVPRGPGVSDCLQKQLDFSQIVHDTEAENLSVITAGNSMPDLLGPLANGVTTSFFDRARSAFDFIVVDSCPILPVIDGLLVSQHADTVVLSVRRDTSEAPQVLRACEKLTAFGSMKHVVVLNGSQEEVFDEYQDHVIATRVEAAKSEEVR
jgi:capsular exopolysaccharide synthesis family protein